MLTPTVANLHQVSTCAAVPQQNVLILLLSVSSNAFLLQTGFSAWQLVSIPKPLPGKPAAGVGFGIEHVLSELWGN